MADSDDELIARVRELAFVPGDEGWELLDTLARRLEELAKVNESAREMLTWSLGYIDPFKHVAAVDICEFLGVDAAELQRQHETVWERAERVQRLYEEQKAHSDRLHRRLEQHEGGDRKSLLGDVTKAQAREKVALELADTWKARRDEIAGVNDRIRTERDALRTERNRLHEGLELALKHLEFNAWKGDPGSDKRFDAVQEARSLLHPEPQEETE